MFASIVTLIIMWRVLVHLEKKNQEKREEYHRRTGKWPPRRKYDPTMFWIDE